MAEKWEMMVTARGLRMGDIRAGDNRGQLDILSSRIGMLAGVDRALMTMYLAGGNSFRQIAHLTGVNEANVARRIHRLTGKLIDGQYITCLRNRDCFTRRELVIAKDYFLDNLSVRQVAAKHKTSIYHIRKTIKRIDNLVTIIRRRNPEAA